MFIFSICSSLLNNLHFTRNSQRNKLPLKKFPELINHFRRSNKNNIEKKTSTLFFFTTLFMLSLQLLLHRNQQVLRRNKQWATSADQRCFVSQQCARSACQFHHAGAQNLCARLFGNACQLNVADEFYVLTQSKSSRFRDSIVSKSKFFTVDDSGYFETCFRISVMVLANPPNSALIVIGFVMPFIVRFPARR